MTSILSRSGGGIGCALLAVATKITFDRFLKLVATLLIAFNQVPPSVSTRGANKPSGW
ncbi:hypothetical protein Hanom_Chr08g00727271 [Helianthus anomalus]